MKKLRVISVYALLALTTLAVALVIVGLYHARIERTQSGVHKRLLIPIGGASFGIDTYAGTGDAVTMPGFLDGPVVRRASNGEWNAVWYCEDKVYHRIGKDSELFIECGGKHLAYPVNRSPRVPHPVISAPGKVVVLSDIEGNAAYLDAALSSLGVTDHEGQWNYGRNHLVIAGDAVDRGREVFTVLWKLYRLSLQAHDAGGAVHIVLGNHEQYMLRGNTSCADADHLYALNQMGGQASAFAADTVIGHWLRQQPVMLKAGDTLITHGGISPRVAATGLALEEMNSAMIRYWNGTSATPAELDAMLGPAGLTHYRGYFEDGGERYALATREDVETVLQRFGANRIVVGHTQVDRVRSFHDGRVWNVDVNSNAAHDEALLIEDGRLSVVSTGVARHIDQHPLRTVRAFAIGDGHDWTMLTGLISSNFALSRLARPY